MKNTSEIFGETIQRLTELNWAELTRFKLATARLAFSDPHPDEADDNPDEEYYDAQTEVYMTLLDLCDQEFERRAALSSG